MAEEPGPDRVRGTVAHHDEDVDIGVRLGVPSGARPEQADFQHVTRPVGGEVGREPRYGRPLFRG